MTPTGRPWGSTSDHAQDKAVFRNLGRLKGEGESKRTQEAGKAPLVFSRIETDERWGCLLTPLTLKGTARRAETQDGNIRQARCSSSCFRGTPFPALIPQHLKADSAVRMQMQLAGHTWHSSLQAAKRDRRLSLWLKQPLLLWGPGASSVNFKFI